MGGLEKQLLILSTSININRRMGGLENWGASQWQCNLINRRMGGLEMQ